LVFITIFNYFENYFWFCQKIEICRKIGLIGSSFLAKKLIFGMRDPQDDKSQLSVSLSKVKIFDLLIAILDIFGVFLIYPLLILKAPVDRTKKHQDFAHVVFERLLWITISVSFSSENYFLFRRKIQNDLKIGGLHVFYWVFLTEAAHCSSGGLCCSLSSLKA